MRPGRSYTVQAAGFIAEARRVAVLGLPCLPADPAAAAAMRAAGYTVLAECTAAAGGDAAVAVLSQDEELSHRVPAGVLAAALDVAVAELPGTQFLAVLRETLADGQVLSGFRRLAAGK